MRLGKRLFSHAFRYEIIDLVVFSVQFFNIILNSNLASRIDLVKMVLCIIKV